MINRTTKLRWRRRLRRSKRQVEDASTQAEEQLERHFFKRLSKLPNVLRFTLTWLALMVLLIGGMVVQNRSLAGYYLQDKPAPGGALTEGILGSFTNANPIYATSSVDKSVASLVFSGLLRVNSKNQLIGDLADSWKVDASEGVYTVHLRDNLTWHDGQPLTADDVVFTYQVIQNPDAKSPLFMGWRDINVQAKDSRTIVFTLPNPLSSFLYNLTNGIIPKHLLKDVAMAQMRSINFNSSSPIGAGPFKWSDIQVSGQTRETREEQITLVPFNNYALGAPKLSKFVIRSFHDEKHLLNSFEKGELTAAVGLSALYKDSQSDIGIHEYDIPILGEVLVFFKTTNSPLDDIKLRRALVMSTDISSIVAKLNYPVVTADEPVLKSQFAYSKKWRQLSFNLNEAKKLLDSDGWKVGVDGVRVKNGQRLSFGIYSLDNPDYKSVTNELKKQWREAGVDLQVSLVSAADLQPKLTNHAYDSLLYGIEVGADPDVFPYWDSSQADIRSQNRLNFSEYRNNDADQSLEAGRTRLNPALRTIKYQPFLQAWQSDAPAVALYQPRFLYVTRGQIFGFEPKTVSTNIDRYANVYNWMIREEKRPIN